MNKEINIKENLKIVYDLIHEEENKAGREQGSVKLVAVSKFHDSKSVIKAIEAGQFLFGENRVQEASAKFDEIRNAGFQADLHIIGTLQRNKVKEAVRIASCIESVDRIELLEEIEKQCEKQNKTIDVFFELKTGEDTKSGFPDENTLLECARLCGEKRFPRVLLKGLMTMAPFTDDEKLITKSFSVLTALKEKINSLYPELCVNELSMGMSNDFKIAVREGATIVRIGTAIFGERDYSK